MRAYTFPVASWGLSERYSFSCEVLIWFESYWIPLNAAHLTIQAMVGSQENADLFRWCLDARKSKSISFNGSLLTKQSSDSEAASQDRQSKKGKNLVMDLCTWSFDEGRHTTSDCFFTTEEPLQGRTYLWTMTKRKRFYLCFMEIDSLARKYQSTFVFGGERK